MTAPTPPPSGPIDRLVNWFAGLGQRLVDGVTRHARLLGDPESMVAALIMTVWAAIAGLSLGTAGVVVAVFIGLALHAAAVESGNHVTLWLSTAGLLILVVVAAAITLGGLHPIVLAGAGATVLAHNELVRLNYTRRRYAKVDPAVFESSIAGLAGAAALAIVGVALANGFAGTDDRTWLWMPIATGALLAIAFALSTLPTWRADEASRERWLPGQRIPPPGTPPPVSGPATTGTATGGPTRPGPGVTGPAIGDPGAPAGPNPGAP